MWHGHPGRDRTSSVEVDLYALQGTFQRDTELAALFLSVPHPSGAWDDLLLPYSGSITLATDASGDVYGPQGNSGQTHPQVYQYLRERWGVDNAESLGVPVP